MNYWHFILIQVNLILFYGIYLLISSKTNHFLFNRIYLLAAPIISIVLPFIGTNLNESGLPQFELDAIRIVSQPLQSVSVNHFSYTNLLIAAGIITSVIVFIYHLYHILSFKKEEVLMKIGKIKIYRTSSNSSFSFLNTIYINDEKTENLDLIVQHEMAHCKQFHSLDLLYFATIKALFWYNPFIYLWQKKIKENHEFLADKEVLKATQNFEEYANAIVSAHFNSSYPHLGASFNAPSLLQRRIKKMKQINTSYMKHLIFIPALAGALFMTTSLSNQQTLPLKMANMTATDELTEPEFPGGTDGLIQFLTENIQYPESSVKANEKGIVYMKFIVQKDGNVSNIEVLRSSSYAALDKEAIRIISTMPTWNPGTKNGKPVDSEMTLPINFAL